MEKMDVKILVFFCYCTGFCCAAAAVNNEEEVSALLLFKSSVVDPFNRLQDWNLSNSNAYCNWTGVLCNSHGAVEGLHLSHMNLRGQVPDNIQMLKTLSSLNLCCNGFSSSLTSSITNLTLLKSIDVSQNLFDGQFPSGLGRAAAGLALLNASSNNFSGFVPEDIGEAVFLEVLDLRGNFFEGGIPKSFGKLRNLKFLGLSGNNLTGKIPAELGQLESLEMIIIGYNEFEGRIPKELGNLTSLRYLDLAVGNLGGEVPAELCRLKSLETVFMHQNNFKGRIPASIGNMTSLILLDLSYNMLSGEIPDTVSALKSLQLLNLMCNQLSGSVPAGLGGLTQLQVLALWSNSLTGPLPADLGKNSALQRLDVSSNSFWGEIPGGLCSSGNLTTLILFYNAFSGPIPDLSTCFSLVRVRVQNNNLSGTVPVGLGKLPKLQRLELANNSLTGQIPNDLASSSSISFIDVSRNSLRSSLPPTILAIPTLQTFMASKNNLEGEIPDKFQDFPSLSVLDLSSNRFSGTIPASIASCEKLVTLNLKNNQLSGEIPTPIAMMPTLAILDLSNNSLTGRIPENFGSSPALEVFNVSHNKLEGQVPANGVLRTINPDDLAGNVGLCGNVLPPCDSTSLTASQQKGAVAEWIIGISSVLAIVIGLIGAWILYKRWRRNRSCYKESFEMGRGQLPWRLIAFQSLGFTSSDILACIKESNVIGMGASGTVYKAEMPQLSAVVAIKKLWRSGSDIETDSNDFVGEVNVLGKLRHRNIVRLLGFLHNDSDMMIIYEYMHNGNLGEALHGKQEGRLLVDWILRYNIAVGVAHGLAYLHHDCHPPVIHRDIKSNNILLDANLEPRIADFGLARMMFQKNETVSTVAGSYGYIAPEYGHTLKVDEKIDIYSYGIVLLELLTGKRPLDPEFGESIDIVEWIWTKIRDNTPIEEALDKNVGNCKHVQEDMLLVLRIALMCTVELPKDRPSMREVIKMLGEAKPGRKSTANSSGHDNNKDKPVLNTSPVKGLV